jgi:molybdopterin-biosynthesis enzyme MoeA-like protein
MSNDPVIEKAAALDAHLNQSIEALKSSDALKSPSFVKPEKPEEKPMSITGLQEGAFQAKLAEMRKKIAETQLNSLSHMDSVVSAGTAKIEEAAKKAAAKAQKEIDDALQEFATMTNGGPA